jgi:hypothetical protein
VAELLEHVLEVGGDGAPRDIQALGDLTIRETLDHEADHPSFADLARATSRTASSRS